MIIDQEGEFYKDRSLITADELESERDLWQWISDSKTIVKGPVVESKKLYLYKPEDENLQLIPQI